MKQTNNAIQKLLCAAVLLLAFASSVRAQSTDVGQRLDRFLDRVTIAAEAAEVIVAADKLRREAEQKRNHGQREEARALLRQAGEIIAAAAPDGDAKRDDPLLRAYLREITAALVSLDDAATASATTVTAYPQVAAYRRDYRGRGRAHWQAGLQRLTAYRSLLARIFREEGVPEWLLAVGLVESGYNPAALSPKQARGIWQFIPATGARYGLRQTAWVDERQNVEKSTRAAARYLRDLHALFGDWQLALAAYNVGEGRVAKALQQSGNRDFQSLAARRLLSTETINYVTSVLAAAQFLTATFSASSEAQLHKTDLPRNATSQLSR